MSLKAKWPMASGRNLTLQVTGILAPGDDLKGQLFSISDLARPEMKGLKIESVLFALQEKMGLLLWWDEGTSDLILPLESRGFFSFVYPIHCPKDWAGTVWWTAFKVDEPKHFYFTMECEPL